MSLSLLPTARQIALAATGLEPRPVTRVRPPRPTMFIVEFGAITMRTVHGDARFDLEQARRLSDILAEGGLMSAWFDLEDALLALSAPPESA